MCRPTPGLTPSCGESESQRFEYQLQGSLAVPCWAAFTFLIWKVGILTGPPSWVGLWVGGCNTSPSVLGSGGAGGLAGGQGPFG